VVVGVTLKWAADLVTEHQRGRRENKLRYLADKRALYADFVLATRQLRELSERLNRLAEEVPQARVLEREHAEEYRTLRAQTDPTDEDRIRIQQLERLDRQRQEELPELQTRLDGVRSDFSELKNRTDIAGATLDLLTSERVQHLAERLLAAATNDESGEHYLQLQRRFLLAAREDLGIPDTLLDALYRRLRRRETLKKADPSGP
jgi:hypothetical protein